MNHTWNLCDRSEEYEKNQWKVHEVTIHEICVKSSNHVMLIKNKVFKMPEGACIMICRWSSNNMSCMYDCLNNIREYESYISRGGGPDTLDDRLAAVAESDEVLILSFFQRNLSLLYNKHDGNNTKWCIDQSQVSCAHQPCSTGALANLGYHPHTENTCRSQGSVGMGLNSIECSKLVTAGKLTIPSKINISPSVDLLYV